MNILDRKDGSYIIRYKVYETCLSFTIQIKYKNEHIAESPYISNEPVHPEDCECNINEVNDWLMKWECGNASKQIEDDLSFFNSVDWNSIRQKVCVFV